MLATTYRYVFTLVGANVLSTAITPTIDDVILLGAVAAIRTVLNYFLSQELEREHRQVAPRPERDAMADAARG